MTASTPREIDATSDAGIAARVALRPIEEVAAKLAIPSEAVYRHGPHKAKLARSFTDRLAPRPASKLILVSAINPTPAGEGKTTTTIGLGDALARLGERVAICLREPSLGPCFGAKGGATGGGHAQIAPMDEINLHFTGDLHAIGAAHNLLAAMIDNHLHWNSPLGLDARRVTWRRVIDLNDRALRNVVVGLGGATNGPAREDGFDITVASEVMAIFCLATSLDDLQARLARMVVGRRADKSAVTAGETGAIGAMAALLRDAFQPNLVQTLEHTPALVHGGPFANIAHGCNSLIATKTGLALADWVVTEAGFGADLGAEKFLDIKCRQGGLTPAAAVVVATVRALKMHGGVAQADIGKENVAAVTAGATNLARHIENLSKFGLPVVVAINRFTSDTQAELDAARDATDALGARAILCEHWAKGGAGAEDLARAVIEAAAAPPRFRTLYEDALPLKAKIERIAREIYRAGTVVFEPAAARRLAEFEAEGFAHLPICMAKTQYGFTADPTLRGAPSGFALPIREVRLSAGVGFVVALCGEIMTMPGLPRRPAAEGMFLDAEGRIGGLS